MALFPWCGDPLLQAFADIALENLSQVVVAVELVFIDDANKSLHGFDHRHGRAPQRENRSALPLDSAMGILTGISYPYLP